ncbi:MAG: hypothetical protein AB7U20_23950, partial [Planctomycetaceae bacterium]
ATLIHFWGGWSRHGVPARFSADVLSPAGCGRVRRLGVEPGVGAAGCKRGTANPHRPLTPILRSRSASPAPSRGEGSTVRPARPKLAINRECTHGKCERWYSSVVVFLIIHDTVSLDLISPVAAA